MKKLSVIRWLLIGGFVACSFLWQLAKSLESSVTHVDAGILDFVLTTIATDKRQGAKYAYAFVIGGCDPDHKPGYRGFIFNILVAAKILQETGSQADVVAMFQLSDKYYNDTLPDRDVKPLEALGIKIRYLAKEPHDLESFYSIVMHKFDILALTQYRRVIFLDGDLIPMGNLDYLFKLSDNGPDSLLKENVVMAGPMEPANAGFFMLEPGEGFFQELKALQAKRETERKFDVVKGWGHKIEPGDEWITQINGDKFRGGRNWTFHFAASDQGLLYFYTKYYRKSVSIMQGRHGDVENWGHDEQGRLQKDVFSRALLNYTRPLLHYFMACKKFVCDIFHFTGTKKPWNDNPLPWLAKPRLTAPQSLWWHTLQDIESTLTKKGIGLGINFTNWTGFGRPPLGYFASNKQINARVRALKQKNVNMVQ